MLPAVRAGTYPETPPRDARLGAVLVLLVPVADGAGESAMGVDPAAIDVVFIERTDDGGPHGGQIAFAGGRAEASDADEYETAFREAEEEIGLDRGRCRPLGSLTPFFVAVSNYVITPVVAWYDGNAAGLLDELEPQPDEVAAILRDNLAAIAGSRAIRRVRARGFLLDAPSFVADGRIVWGATGVIVAELLAVLGVTTARADG